MNLFEIIWKILGWFSNILIIAIVAALIYIILTDKFIFAIAIRNVFRNVRRTLITITAIIIGVIAIIIFGGFITNMYYGLRESTIRSQIGHMQIYKKGYNEFGSVSPLKYKLYDFREIQKIIEDDEALKDKIEIILPEVEFSGLISNGDASTSFIGRGVEPKADKLLSSYDMIVDGKKLSDNDFGKATLGNLLALSLGVKINDILTLLVQTPSVGLNVTDIEVQGTTHSYSTDYDKIFLKIPIQDAWELMSQEYIDKFIILLKDSIDLPLLINEIDKLKLQKNLDIEYKTWRELALFYNSVEDMYNGVFNFVKWIICLIIIVFISNTLFMSVMERVNEIGTIRTIGTTQFTIIKNFMIESMIMGIIGGAAGIILANGLSYVINLFGIPMPPPPGSSTGYTAKIMLDKTSFSYFYFSFKLSLLTALFASILPAKKSIDMNIADALRFY